MLLVDKARALAQKAHEGHVRKSNGTPYFVHLQGVASLLGAAGASEDVIAAAYLHDSLEDAGLTAEAIEAATNGEVALLVLDVSEDKSLPFADRKAKYINDMAVHSEPAQQLALADKLEQIEALHAQLLPLAPEDRPRVWGCFKAGKEGSLAFYRAVLKAAPSRGSETLKSLKRDYAAALKRLEGLK